MESSSASRRPLTPHWIVWLCAAISLWPLARCIQDFRQLFWFGDEWQLLDEISHVGVVRWAAMPFGENIAPIFKLTWGSLVLAGGGSYFALLLATWAAHAACVFILGQWLRGAGFGWIAICITLVIFGLAGTNLETLGWTVQLITVEGMLFFLAAAALHSRRPLPAQWSVVATTILVLLITLSTFAFARGPLVGLSLAAVSLFSLAAPDGANERRHWLAAGLYVVPTIAAVVLIVKFAPGNHQHLTAAAAGPAARFGASYFLLNPFYKFFTAAAWSNSTLVACGAVKIALLTVGWYKASPQQRRVLLLVLLFDLGNAVLMGIGRYEEPIITATSSRYQYISLICTLPFFGVVCEGIVQAATGIRGLQLIAVSILLFSVAWLSARLWVRDMPDWGRDRGTKGREVIFKTPNPPVEGAIPGIPFLQTQRAKELTAEFHLH